MLSTQPQADLPVRFSRLGTTALAGFTPASHAAFFEDSSAPLETRKARYDDFAKLGVPGAMPPIVRTIRPATLTKCGCW